jgi:GNAT superfamily N-acetyltransferase
LNVEIRPMRIGDIDAVTAVHLAAFPDFFLSFLGRRFLRELYRAVLADPNGMAFVAVAGSEVIGFAVGTVNSSGFYRRVARRRWWRFAVASSTALLRRPAIIRRLVRALVSPPATSSEGALFMSAGVDPQVQRSGAGKLLWTAIADEARRRGAKAVVLTTDRFGNDAVNSFHVSQGYELARTYETPEGRAMNEYIKYIKQDG